MAAGDDLEAFGVVVEGKEVGDGSGGEAAHVGVFDGDGWVEVCAAGLEGPGEGRAGSVGHGHGDLVVVDLVEGDDGGVTGSHQGAVGLAHGVGFDGHLEAGDAFAGEDEVGGAVVGFGVVHVHAGEEHGRGEGVFGVGDDGGDVAERWVSAGWDVGTVELRGGEAIDVEVRGSRWD